MPEIAIGSKLVGPEHTPLVIAEIGINHEGDVEKAHRMIADAASAGCTCVKFQCHVIEDEMIPNDVIPGNATESIWNIMKRCALSEQEDRALKEHAERLGLLYLSTPFSRAAADRLHAMELEAYKIGSGECNNLPLIEHIASFGKPVILSTGMNDLPSVRRSVQVLRNHKVPFALLHCTSMYPTPYERVRLGAMTEMMREFPDAVIGLSCHSIGNYTCFAAVALGASIVEKHFASDLSWPGPDVSISIDTEGLADLVRGSDAIHRALGGTKDILSEEAPTIAFAYASVVTVKPIEAGELFTTDNIWVKRPGTGEIRAAEYSRVLGRKALVDIQPGRQVQWSWIQ